MKNDNPIAAGKSSYDLVDKDKLFSILTVKTGETLLDIGCGIGNYTIPLAQLAGEESRIYAIDAWREGINQLVSRAAIKGITNIEAIVGDASKKIPLENESVDICLLATVLHDLAEVNADTGTLKEIRRVLKPKGTLVIIEFEKIEPPPGPPVNIRIAPDELDHLVKPYGFECIETVDIGFSIYLSTFSGNRQLT